MSQGEIRRAHLTGAVVENIPSKVVLPLFPYAPGDTLEKTCRKRHGRESTMRERWSQHIWHRFRPFLSLMPHFWHREGLSSTVKMGHTVRYGQWPVWEQSVMVSLKRGKGVVAVTSGILRDGVPQRALMPSPRGGKFVRGHTFTPWRGGPHPARPCSSIRRHSLQTRQQSPSRVAHYRAGTG